MGVSKLATFLENHCPEAYYEVKIECLAKNYRQDYKCDPVIVVDGSVCFREVYYGLEWVCGGQYKEYVEKLKNFINSFHAINIKLVVFFDGSTQDSKRRVWTMRRNQELDRSHKIFDALSLGMTVQKQEKKCWKNCIYPVGVFDTMRTVAKDMCQEVHYTLKECDEEMVNYAEKNKCFAILTNDTDFVIHQNGAKCILSAKHLKLKSMTTFMYDQMALARHLQLQVSDLPMFASLMGNDFISVLDLHGFHKQLVDGQGGKNHAAVFQKVAEYVGRLSKGESSIPCLRELSVAIFGGVHRAEDLQKSISSYSTVINEDAGPTNSTPTLRNWDQIMSIAHKNFVDAVTPPFLYNILGKFTFSMGTALEDHRKPLIPSAAALRNMRQRMYGVALQECPQRKQGFCIDEWCMLGENSLDSAQKVPIIFPPENSPNLLEMWLNPGNEEIISKKFKLLRWICSPEHLHALDADLSAFPDQLVAAICILSYLHHSIGGVYSKDVSMLTDLEVRIFASVVVDVQAMNSYELAKIFVEKVDVRGVQLATLFTRAITHLELANCICGQPIASEWMKHYQLFDGKLFQISYLEGKAGNVRPKKGNCYHFQQICQAVLQNSPSQQRM